MRRIAIVLLAVLLLIDLTSDAHSSVLTFDNIDTIDTYYSIPDNYGGLSWSLLVYFNKSYYDHGVVSGDYAASNFYGPEPKITSTVGSFDFIGAYFMAGSGYPNFQMIVLGINDGAFVDQKLFNLSILSPTWIDFGFEGIDELRFLAPVFNNDPALFVMDDFTYNPPNPVPIPKTFFLLGFGLVGFCGAMRQLKRIFETF